MKKNRQIFLKSLIILVMAMFSFSLANAQEEKQEKKVIKMKVLAEDDGEVRIDTMILLNEDFDGDWSAIIDDEELLKKLEDLDVDLEIEGEANVYMVKAPHTQKQAYTYTVISDDEGEVRVNVETESQGDGLHEVFIKEIDGDSTITILLKSGDCIKEGKDHEVMIWHSDEDGEEKEYKVITLKSDEFKDVESEVTYKIRMESGEEGEEVLIWNIEDDPENNIIIKEIEGDSIKVFVTTSDEMSQDEKVIKKEVIIITEEDGGKKDKDKDKKKKKKK
jgi:hypothetical protein